MFFSNQIWAVLDGIILIRLCVEENFNNMFCRYFANIQSMKNLINIEFIWLFLCMHARSPSYMAGFSQPKHLFASACLFWVFGSMRASIGSSRIFMGSRIFLFEVWSHSDFQLKKNFGHFGGRNDPPNLEYAPKWTKLVNFRP